MFLSGIWKCSPEALPNCLVGGYRTVMLCNDELREQLKSSPGQIPTNSRCSFSVAFPLCSHQPTASFPRRDNRAGRKKARREERSTGVPLTTEETEWLVNAYSHQSRSTATSIPQNVLSSHLGASWPFASVPLRYCEGGSHSSSFSSGSSSTVWPPQPGLVRRCCWAECFTESHAASFPSTGTVSSSWQYDNDAWSEWVITITPISTRQIFRFLTRRRHTMRRQDLCQTGFHRLQRVSLIPPLPFLRIRTATSSFKSGLTRVTNINHVAKP